MFYLGIDIGKFNHAAALMDQRGKVIATLSSFPNTHSGFQKLLALISSHLPQQKSCVSVWRQQVLTGSRWRSG